MRILAPTLIACLLASPALAETKTYNITGFTRIEADAAYVIEFTQGPFAVKADSRENNLDQIVIEKSGDTLRITRPNRSNINHDIEDIIYVSAPRLDGIRLHSAVSFKADKINGDTLKIVAHSATKVAIRDVDVKSLDIDAHSAASFDLRGDCGKLTLKLDSASKFEGAGLHCREAAIDAGTASKIHAWASEKARVDAGTASSVTIGGRPKDFDSKTAKFASNVTVTD
jgi:hypothetical protein